LGKKLYDSLKIDPNFFLQHFKTKIIINFVKFVATKKGMTINFFSPLSFVAVLGSGIRDPGSGSGMGKNQDPATLLIHMYSIRKGVSGFRGVPRGDAQDARASPLPPLCIPPRPCASPPPLGNKKKMQVCLPKHNYKLDNNLLTVEPKAVDPYCFDVDPDPAQNAGGGGGVGQPKMCIPPGKILGTPLSGLTDYCHIHM
jgi:hypothetical protein